MNGKLRPKAESQTPAKKSDAIIPPVRDDVAEWLAVGEAEHIVAEEYRALTALQALSTEQIRSLVWVGMLDDGWRRMFAELWARGEDL